MSPLPHWVSLDHVSMDTSFSGVHDRMAGSTQHSCWVKEFPFWRSRVAGVL